MYVAIYARKSKSTKKGESITNQIDLCKKYFNNYNDNEINFYIYKDEGFSGKNTNRPGFMKLISDAKAKKFQCLICYKLDRIARNVADFSTTYRILEENNIDFISITERFDTNTVMGRAMINISATFAQMERETIAERIRDNMLELSKTGRWLGGTPPLGFKSVSVDYDSSNIKKKMFMLETIDSEIEIVRLIFKLFIQYKSCSPIAKYLVSNSIKGKNGGDFSRNTVLQIIKNPVYCCSSSEAIEYFKNQGSTVNCINNSNLGLMVYNKRKGGKIENPKCQWIISTGKHIGIIPAKHWLLCQRILEENKEKNSPREKTGNKFLLSGLLKCKLCGSSMCSWSRNDRGHYYRSYRCEMKNRSSNRCACKTLNANEVETFVIELIKNLNIEKLNNDNLITSNINNYKTEINLLKKSLYHNKSIAEGLIKKLALIDDKEILCSVQLEIKKINSENARIESKLNELNLSIKNNNELLEKKKLFLENLTLFKSTIDLLQDVTIKRQLIMNLIEYFVYDSTTGVIEYKLNI